jgi:hypothetical protein
MNKSLDKINQSAKFLDIVKIGIISGSFLGFAEGVGLSISIIKDNENSFLSIGSASKFLNTSITIYSLVLLFINSV